MNIQLEAGPLAERPEIAGYVSGQSCEVDGLVKSLSALRFDTGEFQKCVDELQKSGCVAICNFDIGGRTHRQQALPVRERVSQRAKNQGERRPEFVTHV